MVSSEEREETLVTFAFIFVHARNELNVEQAKQKGRPTSRIAPRDNAGKHLANHVR